METYLCPLCPVITNVAKLLYSCSVGVVWVFSEFLIFCSVSSEGKNVALCIQFVAFSSGFVSSSVENYVADENKTSQNTVSF